MAVSLDRPAEEEMIASLAVLAIGMAEKLHKYPAPPGSVLNLNAPALKKEQWLPAVMAPVNHGLFTNIYEQRENPSGQTYFWVTPEFRREPPRPLSDEYFLQKGHITCTFLLHTPENPENCLDFLQDA
jgi:5'-nucleotidase